MLLIMLIVPGLITADMRDLTGGTCGVIVLITLDVTEADDVQHGGHILSL